jgi:hypothetical protein
VAITVDGTQTGHSILDVASLLLVVKHAREQAEAARRMARIALETANSETIGTAKGATAGGDRSRLRGLPAVGPGCGSGAVAGSDPLQALLAKESRRER